MELDAKDHEALLRQARRLGLTLSNHIRSALKLPLERQGVKRPELKRKGRKEVAA